LDDVKPAGKAPVDTDTPCTRRTFTGFDRDEAEDVDVDTLRILYGVASRILRFSWVAEGP
jgi:hypothetical protein